LVTTLTYGKEDIKVEDIVAALLAHDQRRNNVMKESFGDAFQVKGDRNVEDKRGNKKKVPQCYKCKGWGHVKRDYPELKKDRGSISVVIANKKKDDSDSNGDILTMSSEKSCEAWLLDSASLFHATSKKELFLSYTEKENGFAYLGDGLGYLAAEEGDIRFKLYDRKDILLKVVKHVPWLTRNLISLGLLHEEGWFYQAVPDKKTLSVMHGGKTDMIGKKSSAHQYKLKGSVIEGGVIDGNANVTVFYPDGHAAVGSALCHSR
jgi:hypothetical protein